MRILIVEDDHTSRIVLEGILKQNGYEVLVKSNGREALEVLRQDDSPRLVILDWVMPELDGVEVIRRVRSLPTELPPYIILLTARGEKSDVIVGLESGADDYLAKPFDPGELRARVEVGRRMIGLQETLRAHQETLRHQARHDPLTGLLNRRSILEHLHLELVKLDRQQGILAVGMGDVDYFKRVNDSHGHKAGDDILRGITQIFQGYSQGRNAFGRIGGEEFLIVAPMEKNEDPVVWFDRLRTSVHQTPFFTKKRFLTCSMSIGVTWVRQEHCLEKILETADLALYQAKNQGRNCVVGHEMFVEE